MNNDNILQSMGVAIACAPISSAKVEVLYFDSGPIDKAANEENNLDFNPNQASTKLRKTVVKVAIIYVLLCCKETFTQ